MSAASAYGAEPHSNHDTVISTSSSTCPSIADSHDMSRSHSIDPQTQAKRPSLGGRQSSGSMIIPANSKAELDEGEVSYPADDVRCMSPKRSIEDVERLSEDARTKLEKQAQLLQESLLAIVDRIETVKTEHEKLEGGNKFLQSYIGELIQTSKITSTGSSKTKLKGRA